MELFIYIDTNLYKEDYLTVEEAVQKQLQTKKQRPPDITNGDIRKILETETESYWALGKIRLQSTLELEGKFKGMSDFEEMDDFRFMYFLQPDKMPARVMLYFGAGDGRILLLSTHELKDFSKVAHWDGTDLTLEPMYLKEEEE